MLFLSLQAITHGKGEVMKRLRILGLVCLLSLSSYAKDQAKEHQADDVDRANIMHAFAIAGKAVQLVAAKDDQQRQASLIDSIFFSLGSIICNTTRSLPSQDYDLTLTATECEK
jgi:hypothetical protein